MPISTIADALNSVGTSVNQTMQQAAERRRQDLQAQQQTNDLTMRQGLLALEAQKAQSTAELGLAKAGSEVRQFDVKTELERARDAETARYHTGDLQMRGRAADTADRTVTETSTHNRATERTTAQQVQQQGGYYNTLAQEAKARGGLLEQQTTKARQENEAWNAPVDFELWSKDFRAGVIATYGEKTGNELLGEGSTTMQAMFPDLEKYRDPTTHKILMPQGLITSRTKAVMETMQLRKKAPVSEEDMGKRIDMTHKSMLTKDDDVQTQAQKYAVAEALHRYPEKYAEAMRLIDDNRKALFDKNKALALAQKQRGRWVGTAVLTPEEEDDIMRKTVEPLAVKEQMAAAQKLRLTNGQDHGVVAIKAPPAPGAPPPPTTTSVPRAGTAPPTATGPLAQTVRQPQSEPGPSPSSAAVLPEAPINRELRLASAALQAPAPTITLALEGQDAGPSPGRTPVPEGAGNRLLAHLGTRLSAAFGGGAPATPGRPTTPDSPPYVGDLPPASGQTIPAEAIPAPMQQQLSQALAQQFPQGVPDGPQRLPMPDGGTVVVMVQQGQIIGVADLPPAQTEATPGGLLLPPDQSQGLLATGQTSSLRAALGQALAQQTGGRVPEGTHQVSLGARTYRVTVQGGQVVNALGY